MPKITIEWTKYEFQFPAVMTEAEFYNLREKFKLTNKLDIFPKEHSLWKEFNWLLILICLGLFSMYDGINRLHILNDFIAIIFFLAGVGAAVRFIPSVISFLAVNHERHNYFHRLQLAIMNNDNYNSFCKELSKIDLRYKRLII